MSELKSMLEGAPVREKLSKLKARCRENGLSLKRKDFNYDDRGSIEAYIIRLSKPHFSDLDFYVTTEKDVDIALSENLHNLASLETLSGYVNLESNIIEVQITSTSVFGTIDKERLLGANKNELLLVGGSQQPTIRIGPESELSRELRSSTDIGWSVRLEGVSVKSADEAEVLIKRYCAQIFFNILDERRLGLRLKRRIRRGYRSRVMDRKMKEIAQPSIVLKYPDEVLSFIPVALLAASSDSLLPPSFQFLLRYQAVEFFMLRANRTAAFESIKEVIDSTDFNSSNRNQLSKLLKIIKPQWVNPLTRELEQLITLMQNSSLLGSLRSFLENDFAVMEHVASRHKFTSAIVKADFNDVELAKAVANRIYDIRNAIVHAKEDSSGERNLLLIESADEEIVDLDSAFLGFIAKETVRSLGSEEKI